MKEEILALLRQTSDYVSGETISRQLGVTRAAVWKTVGALRREGYPIEAVTRRGYRLAGEADVLDEESIHTALRQEDLAAFFPYCQFARSAESTNQLAKQGVDRDHPSGSLYVAENQTAGRGRRGRTWYSDGREGLSFSLLLRPQLPPDRLSLLTLFAGLCLAEGLAGDLALPVGIKWPNDLVGLASGRKLSGILTEMIVEEQTATAVIIGIGINVNTRVFPFELTKTASSLLLESGRRQRRLTVLLAFLRHFAARYPAYAASEDWLADYRRHCLTLGREVLVLPEGQPAFGGIARDLGEAGELVVEDPLGRRRKVLAGEVSVRGLLGYTSQAEQDRTPLL